MMLPLKRLNASFHMERDMPYPKKLTPGEKAMALKKGKATAKKVIKKAAAAKKNRGK